MALNTTLDEELDQYFYMGWDVLGQSLHYWAAVTEELGVAGAHIILMLELSVHVRRLDVYLC